MKNKSLIMMMVCLMALGLGATAKKATGNMDKMKMQMMENMKKVMSMKPEDMKAHMMTLQQAALSHGKTLFEQPGPNGTSCSSCHPGGSTTGGMAEPMPGMRIPIPTLVGASGTFPKFKVPNNAVITLPQMNNNCRMTFMNAKPLPLDGRDATDLAAYVSSLSNGRNVELGAHHEMEMKGMKK